jgi:hypothetical protein
VQGNWLIPFKGRNQSGPYEQNFLWRQDSVYIMDNHRAALWCWLQHLEKDGTYNLFHFDRHFDTLSSRIDEWKRHLPDLWTIGIQEYLELSYHLDDTMISDVPIIRYDNYLSLFLECYGDLVSGCWFATHGKGDKPRFTNTLINVSVWEIPAELDYWLSSEATFNEYAWILNMDLDYFFCDYPNSRMLMMSDKYIETVFTTIAQKYHEGMITVLTVCLSPEYCGNWKEAEKLCSYFCEIIGLDFDLPE